MNGTKPRNVPSSRTGSKRAIFGGAIDGTLLAIQVGDGKLFRMRALAAPQLRGVWAAVPTPWTTELKLDTVALEANLQQYESWGAAGVYTTDSDGEFYAIELDDFRHLVQVFGRAMAKTSMDAAVGVTWSNTKGVIDRIKAATDAGIPNVHFAFPFWMPLAKPDVPRFFEDLATAVPESRWVHYHTPRGHVRLSGVEYAEYQGTYPNQFIGTKLGTTDIIEIADIISHSPRLAHFGVECSAVIAALIGAQGNYSYWINTLPRWTIDTWTLCEQGYWKEAMLRQSKLIRWETEFMDLLRAVGHHHAVIGKARAALSSRIVDNGLTRPPYYPAAENLIVDLRSHFNKFWAEEREQEDVLLRENPR